MGIQFYNNLSDSGSYYNCEGCGVYLSNKTDILSTSFTGVTGQAYLFKKVANIKLGKCCQREMMTGIHYVRDVFCLKCEKKIGWMYELAIPESERYKEGAVTLEKKLIKKVESGFEEDPQRTRNADETAGGVPANNSGGFIPSSRWLTSSMTHAQPQQQHGSFESTETAQRARNAGEIVGGAAENNVGVNVDAFISSSGFFSRAEAHRHYGFLEPFTHAPRFDFNMRADSDEEMRAVMNERPLVESPTNLDDLDEWTDYGGGVVRRVEGVRSFSLFPRTSNHQNEREGGAWEDLQRSLAELTSPSNRILIRRTRREGQPDQLEVEEVQEQPMREPQAPMPLVERDSDDGGTTEDGDEE